MAKNDVPYPKRKPLPQAEGAVFNDYPSPSDEDVFTMSTPPMKASELFKPVDKARRYDMPLLGEGKEFGKHR